MRTNGFHRSEVAEVDRLCELRHFGHLWDCSFGKPRYSARLFHIMTFDFILTHPGGAHKDEFLACCLLLTQNEVPIVRREPTDEDLANPAVCVVDVGHQHDPEKNNFDHHQFPKDDPPTCSLSLVLQRLGLYVDAKQFCDWLEPAEWFDCRGAKDTAEMLGAPREVMNQLVSPIDVTVLRRFAQCERLESGDPIWELMKMIGEDLLSYLRTLRERLNYIAEHSEFWDIEANGESFKVLYMPRTEPLPAEPSMGLPRFIEGHEHAPHVVGMIYPDRRGSGHGLTRFNDDLRLDFTRIGEESDVHFAHARGFVAKTSATETGRLKALVSAAWVGSTGR